MIEALMWLVVTVLAALALRRMIHFKQLSLNISEQTRVKFYSIANELLDSEELNERQIHRIKLMSSMLQYRISQFVVSEAVRLSKKEEEAQARSGLPMAFETGQSKYTEGLSDETRVRWTRMVVNWLVAVSAQGSILGLGSVKMLVDYLDPEEPKNENDSIVSRIFELKSIGGGA